MREFYKLQKMIVHREIKDLKGHEYDHYRREAEAFVQAMRQLMEMK